LTWRRRWMYSWHELLERLEKKETKRWSTRDAFKPIVVSYLSSST
jgi:hypothetical protein